MGGRGGIQHVKISHMDLGREGAGEVSCIYKPKSNKNTTTTTQQDYKQEIKTKQHNTMPLLVLIQNITNAGKIHSATEFLLFVSGDLKN